MTRLYQLIKTDSNEGLLPSQTIAAVMQTLRHIAEDLRDIDHKAQHQRPKSQFVKAAGGCAYVSANRLKEVCKRLDTISFPNEIDVTNDLPETTQLEQAIELLNRLAIATLNYDTIKYPLKKTIATQAAAWLTKHGHIAQHEIDTNAANSEQARQAIAKLKEMTTGNQTTPITTD